MNRYSAAGLVQDAAVGQRVLAITSSPVDEFEDHIAPYWPSCKVRRVNGDQGIRFAGLGRLDLYRPERGPSGLTSDRRFGAYDIVYLDLPAATDPRWDIDLVIWPLLNGSERHELVRP